MKRFFFAGLLFAVFLPVDPVLAQKQELGLTLGHILANQRTTPSGSLDLSSGLALEANYGLRVYKARAFAVYFETHFLANGLREVAAADLRISRDFATAYMAPGIRMRFAPGKAIQPYVALGGGYALYEQSKMTLAGDPNPAPRFTHGTTMMFGGGADTRLWKFIGVRAEIRDFYSRNPSFNVEPLSSRQHNVVIGGGFVLRFGENR